MASWRDKLILLSFWTVYALLVSIVVYALLGPAWAVMVAMAILSLAVPIACD